MFLAERLGLAPELVATIRVAGLLHDVGKIGVPDGILRKPGSLTAEEYAIVKQHVALGDLIVRDLPDVEVIRAGVRHHHERWDGDGYLDRLAGEEIPLVARILAVGDAFSAMTTTRPYRKALRDRRGAPAAGGCGRQPARRAARHAVRGRHRDDRRRPAARRRCRVPPAVDPVPPGRLMPARDAATGPRRRLRASAGLVTIVALLAIAGVSAGPGRAATSTWTITLTPSTIEALQATTIKATFWNLGGPDGQQDLGCVRIAIPATFTVGATQVTDSPPGTTWKASKAGLTTVTIKTPSGGDRLPPGHPGASVTAAITVSAVLPGTYTWTANAFRAQDCKDPFNDPAQLSVVVTLTLLPHTDADADTDADRDPDTDADGRPRSRRCRRSPTLPPLPTPTPRPTPTPVVTPTPPASATPTPPTTGTPQPSSTAEATGTPGSPGAGSTPGPGTRPERRSVGRSLARRSGPPS